ncbi:MAG: hypothetical protein EU539_01890 [Promethearchaeota archaeon]|nr:MAG: hypothetical protein EU539_01890 [Candidatus Lokiarchaeota archaeon]
MGKWINYVTFFRNLIVSVCLGLIGPFLIVMYVDPKESFLNLSALLINGGIFVAVYTIYGLFRKETIIRFLIGIGWIGTLIYFYTVGNNFFTFYLPHCAFGTICMDGKYRGIEFAFKYNYAWVVICILVLKGLNILRHLIKPVEEQKYDYLTISKKIEK